MSTLYLAYYSKFKKICFLRFIIYKCALLTKFDLICIQNHVFLKTG